MRYSWHVGIVILTLVGLSGCAGVQQRGRSSSPMEGLSLDVPGRPGWPTRLFKWRLASAEPRVETTTRRAARAPAVAPETDIWPDRSRGVLSRLLTSFPSSRSQAAGAGSSVLSRREPTTSAQLTVAEANAAIARAARPRTAPASVPATRDASVLTTRGEAPADDQPEAATPDAPPLLEVPIALPGDDAAERASEAAASAPAIEPDAILTQAPPPPPLRPTPRPVEPKPAPEPEPQPEPEPAEITPPVEPVKPAEPEPKPEPEPEPAEVVPPVEPTPEPVEPTKPAEPAEPSRPVETGTERPTEAPAPSVAPSPVQEPASPFAASQAPRPAPVVAAAPQVYFDSPVPGKVAPAPLRPHEDAPPRWAFWSWKKAPSHGGGFPIETSAQLPAVQFPASYDSIAARPLTPCPDYARVVTPTAQQRIVLPSAQSVATAPVEKCWRLKALGARLHEKLERLRAWKHEHICKHIQNFKAALRGGKCSDCGGHAGPMASPQSAPPVLATSQFGLY